MEKKIVKNDLEMAFWLGSLINDEREDMCSALNIIKNMSDDELREFVEKYQK